MLSFNHFNVMSLTGICFDGDLPLLIMPFMINGTLLDYVKKNRESLYFAFQANDKMVISAFAKLGVSDDYMYVYTGEGS